MFLMIDNYDSFVYNLVRYIEELGREVIVRRNDDITIEEIIYMNVKGIIISPGPKSPNEAGISLQIVNQLKGIIPILGICLGHQVIAQAFGGYIIRGCEPVHGKVFSIIHNGKGIFSDIISPINVTRYHSLIVERESLPNCFEITSETNDGIIMSIKHRELLIEGLQFHPEAELTEYGHKMINNFVDNCYQN